MEQPKQSNSIVAYIDILGFKDIIKSNRQQGDNKIFKEILTGLKDAYEYVIEQGEKSTKHFKQPITAIPSYISSWSDRQVDTSVHNFLIGIYA